MDNNQSARNQRKKDGSAKNLASVLPATGKGEILSDVNGSYTGTPVDHGTPVQDADDL